eukprot:ANDGO_07641.mRNA.1 hypothetical protein
MWFFFCVCVFLFFDGFGSIGRWMSILQFFKPVDVERTPSAPAEAERFFFSSSDLSADSATRRFGINIVERFRAFRSSCAVRDPSGGRRNIFSFRNAKLIRKVRLTADYPGQHTRGGAPTPVSIAAARTQPYISRIAFHPSQSHCRIAAVASTDGKLTLLKTALESPLWIANFSAHDRIESVAWSDSSSKYLAVGFGTSRDVLLIDAGSGGKTVHTYTSTTGGGHFSVSFLPVMNALAAGGRDGKVRLFDLRFQKSVFLGAGRHGPSERKAFGDVPSSSSSSAILDVIPISEYQLLTLRTNGLHTVWDLRFQSKVVRTVQNQYLQEQPVESVVRVSNDGSDLIFSHANGGLTRTVFCSNGRVQSVLLMRERSCSAADISLKFNNAHVRAPQISYDPFRNMVILGTASTEYGLSAFSLDEYAIVSVIGSALSSQDFQDVAPAFVSSGVCPATGNVLCGLSDNSLRVYQS